MKARDYFIWEKSHVNNKGMKIKFGISPYCYIKPTMCTTWDTLRVPKEMQRPMTECLYCRNKIYFWLWFRLIIESETRAYGGNK